MNDFTLPPRPALSETSCQVHAPMLVSWGARALYVGPSLQLAAHRNAVAVLAIALDGMLEVAHVADQPLLGFARCKTVLIEPNALHLIRSTGRRCAFLYLDALSDDLPTIRHLCGESRQLQPNTEDALIGLLCAMEHDANGWHSTRPALAAELKFARAQPDRRVSDAIDTLTRAPGQATHASDLALAAGLSASRFQHLFKQATGVPFRRFRTWTRLRAALESAQDGTSLTAAAHAAGFASSAHFSTAFKDMFGLAPSQLLALKPVLIGAEGELHLL